VPKAIHVPDTARKLAGSEGSYEDTLRSMFEGIQSQDDIAALLGGGTAGSVIPIANGSISSSDEYFTLSEAFDTTYPLYYVHIRQMLVSAASKPFGVIVGTDEGATDYSYVQWKHANGTFTSNYSVGNAYIQMMDLVGSSSANSEELTMWLWINNPGESSYQTTFEWRAHWHNSGTTVYYYEGAGSRKADQADTTIKLITDPGGSTTFSSGTFTVYGIKQT
jgi:hypothetical protein